MVTQKYLREWFHYDRETGNFIRRKAKPGFSVGQIAGFFTKRGYIYVKIEGQTYKAHRLAWLYVTGRWPPVHMDHINGKPWDNRLINLREATRPQNLANSKRYKNNTSGYKGVSWHTVSGKWMASIQANGNRIHLGLFDTPKLAYRDYLLAAKKHHGKYARGG